MPRGHVVLDDARRVARSIRPRAPRRPARSPRFPHAIAGDRDHQGEGRDLADAAHVERVRHRRSSDGPTTRTAASRTRISAAAQTGNAPRTTSAINPAAIASRSATGSRILPSSDTCPVRRAIVPSTQSVATTSAEQHDARRRRVGIDDQGDEHGDQRDACSGDQVRNGEDRAATPPVGSAVAFHRSGRPDLNRRPSVPQTDALTKLRHGPKSRIVPVARTAALERCLLVALRGRNCRRIGTPSRSKVRAQPVLEVSPIAVPSGSLAPPKIDERRRARSRPASRSGACPRSAGWDARAAPAGSPR